MALVPHKPEDAAFLKALVFGPPGAGKTRFLGTADDDERTYPMAFLNFEAGEQTLSGRDTDVYDIRSWADYNEAYAMLSAPGCKYRSVGIDSITETQVDGLLSILTKDKTRADPDQLSQPDWGIILVQMRRFVRHYKFLPMHVFMTALSKEEAIVRRGMVRMPAVQGAFANELPGVLDVVAYMAQEDLAEGGTLRVLLLQNDSRFLIKARTPWVNTVPDYIEDPTVGGLLDAMGYKAAPPQKGKK